MLLTMVKSWDCNLVSVDLCDYRWSFKIFRFFFRLRIWNNFATNRSHLVGCAFFVWKTVVIPMVISSKSMGRCVLVFKHVYPQMIRTVIILQYFSCVILVCSKSAMHWTCILNFGLCFTSNLHLLQIIERQSRKWVIMPRVYFVQSKNLKVTKKHAPD